MGKISSHYNYYCSLYCNINSMIIMKYICFVIIFIGSFKMRYTFAVIGVEMSQQNDSVVSMPFESAYATTSKLPTTSTGSIDFDTMSGIAVEGAALQGWQCHCWNSTNGQEV